MILKPVMSDNMLMVLALKHARHLRPSPHTQQRELQLIIHFSEFAKLCSGIRQYGEQILTEPSEKLDKLAKRYMLFENASFELKSIFLKEVALAVLREVHYHQRFGRGLTKIRYHMPSSNDKVTKSVSTSSSENSSLLKELLELTKRNGYSVSGDNLELETYEAIEYARQTYAKSKAYRTQNQ